MQKAPNVHYGNLFLRAMAMWERYSVEYRTLIPRYKELLGEKRKLEIQPLDKINKSDLAGYPEIEFLHIKREEDAEEYLLNLAHRELIDLVVCMDSYADSRIRRLLLARICDYKQQIRLSKCYKSSLLMDPISCGTGPIRHRHTKTYTDHRH